MTLSTTVYKCDSWYYGSSALKWGAFYGHMSIVKAAARNGANVYTRMEIRGPRSRRPVESTTSARAQDGHAVGPGDWLGRLDMGHFPTRPRRRYRSLCRTDTTDSRNTRGTYFCGRMFATSGVDVRIDERMDSVYLAASSNQVGALKLSLRHAAGPNGRLLYPTLICAE
ncbi:uncharacterized protein EURHEDRAFT_404053 [Aspergillus ruber CBS 135680]|uniref:Uncharacterized protein n=1 Tax=Aspergillus ruber (strain CBS 135680) TaxID=1388766 RepID=A0A017S9P6_ASPRC|nr:uncharacterized protein EURHEDRAFT_404053 [Aspergillus ruber CBS 135680]EYE93642.1 hypothetical protein EURHEDRAFT_404053 [Aspergillus ruber CBS 135680]